MIAKLKGTVDAIDGDSAVIDVNGVGYLVSASARTLRDLVVGGPATLLVETIVREDAIALYGFLETAERDWFRILTTVQGVGARVALAILSTLAPARAGLPVFEYAANLVKKSVTGVGHAEKRQIAMMVGRLLPGVEATADAADALAVAICHAHHRATAKRVEAAL